MKLLITAAASVVALMSVPTSAATTVTYDSMNPGGLVTLPAAGPGAVSNQIGFDVQGTGDFSVTFTFTNPFEFARANGSASFNFDPDVLVFTGGNFSGGGSVALGTAGGMGSSIQIDRVGLAQGLQTLTLFGRLNSDTTPDGGNNFARIGGSLTLTQIGVVPEPATWALFILGFGAIGGALRRRASTVRISKARLNFA